MHVNEILAELRSNFPGQVFEPVIKSTVRVKEARAAGCALRSHCTPHSGGGASDGA